MRSQPVHYLSEPAAVSMDDHWYEVATLEHPWVVRRFEVLKQLAGRRIQGAAAIAEVGCGHGLLQRQIEDAYGVTVTGFDLRDAALKRTASRFSPVCCYDVLEQKAGYARRFDLILLFDVLEHVEDEERFLRALRFHLAPGGSVLINVPAFQSLFSAYDRAVGHLRRYSIASFGEVTRRSGLTMAGCSYWGWPLMPLLILRKLWLSGRSGESVLEAGFGSNGPMLDRLLLWVSRCEPIPQRMCGTSFMAVLEEAP